MIRRPPPPSGQTAGANRAGAHRLLTATLCVLAAATACSPSDPAPPIVTVPDPRTGDLRIDDEADTLPSDYLAPEAPVTLADLAYGPDDEHRIDLYLPTDPRPPVVLFLHSGGWVGGTRKGVPPMVLRFVERGYAVAAADYRLAPDHAFPNSLEDTKRAVRWLKASDETAALVDGDRIVIYGTSAGGHLAAMAATTVGSYEPEDLPIALAQVDSSVVGIVSVVGPTDLVTFYDRPHAWAKGLTEALLGCSPCAEDELANASPAAHLHEDLPPAYWAYGENDPLVDPHTQGGEIAARWATHAGPEHSWLDLIEGSGHNVDSALVNQRWLERFVDDATAAT